MIEIIKFQGGLGNQMFQYAFYLSLKHKHPLSVYLFDTEWARCCHNGFELLQLFPNISVLPKKLYSGITKYCPSVLCHPRIVAQNDSLQYSESVYDYHRGVVLYDGYWQTEKFFLGIENLIRASFRFDISMLKQKNLECIKGIRSTNSVSIHFRRGDYLNEAFRLVCDDDYYRRAISVTETIVNDPSFFVFSDDIDYVKKHIFIPNCTFVDWNIGKDNWQDMYLMSQCKHNIIANSSFSWWGAWLNNNPEKIIVAPKLWFMGAYNEDVVPSTWIRL